MTTSYPPKKRGSGLSKERTNEDTDLHTILIMFIDMCRFKLRNNYYNVQTDAICQPLVMKTDSGSAFLRFSGAKLLLSNSEVLALPFFI